MPRLSPVDDLRFYFYRSQAKIEMLYEQIVESTDRSRRNSVSADLKVVKFETESTKKAKPTLEDKLRLVEEELEARGLVGSFK